MNTTVHYNFLQLPNIITTFQKLNSVTHFTEKHLHHKIQLSTFAELFRLTVCISETTVFIRFSALGTY